MKSTIKKFLKKLIFLLVFSLAYLGIGYIVALLISHRFNYKLQDVMTYEGIILVVIGILMSMKGNPSGISISGMGTNNANITSYLNNEILRQEREMNPYYKDFFKNNVVKFAFGNVTLILGGIFIFAFSAIFC